MPGKGNYLRLRKRSSHACGELTGALTASQLLALEWRQTVLRRVSRFIISYSQAEAVYFEANTYVVAV